MFGNIKIVLIFVPGTLMVPTARAGSRLKIKEKEI